MQAAKLKQSDILGLYFNHLLTLTQVEIRIAYTMEDIHQYTFATYCIRHDNAIKEKVREVRKIAEREPTAECHLEYGRKVTSKRGFKRKISQSSQCTQ